jgi:hypothetical protein
MSLIAGWLKRHVDAGLTTAAKTDNADCRAPGVNVIPDIRPTHADGMNMPNSTNSFATCAAHACASSHPVKDATPACGLRSAFSSAGISPTTFSIRQVLFI